MADEECQHGMNPEWCADCKGLELPDEEDDREIFEGLGGS